MKDPLSGGRVHIIGIGGIGMSANAEIMAARGLDVQGSDQKDGANLRRLSSKGIKVFVGQCAENLEGATTVVISTAVKDDFCHRLSREDDDHGHDRLDDG